MEAHQIDPVHLYSNCDDFNEALEQVKRDVVPYQFAWQFVKGGMDSFEAFCEFLNVHKIENWVCDNETSDLYSIRLRLSQFKRAVEETGISHNGFHLS